jgi:aldose 1-epimerase
MRIKKTLLGTTPEGRRIDQFTMINGNGLSVSLMTYGGILTSVKTPDKDGKCEEITLGFEALAPYLEDHPYFGAIIGRCANRIANGRFMLGAEAFSLFCNDGTHHLHGGEKGFDKAVWGAMDFEKSDSAGVRLTYLSRDNEEGYPGNLSAAVTYSLTASDELVVEYEAESDRPTPVNLTIHPYWNLAGPGRGSIASHELKLYSDHYLAVDDEIVPTGRINDVTGTPFDFTKPKRIGQDLDRAGGYDHCFVIRAAQVALAPAAELFDPLSRRRMEIFTSQRGIQFYSGNFLDGRLGRGTELFEKHGGLCLETQGFPDAVNHASFPSPILRPGEKYHETARYRFSVGRD